MNYYSSCFVGSEFIVNSENESYQIDPSISALGNGGFVVAWKDSSGTLGDADGTSIKATIFDQYGSKLTGEFLVNSEIANYQFNPATAALANGGFIVSWSDTSGTLGDSAGTSIKAQVFDASGGQIGSEFVVNSATDGDQYNSAITGLAGGGFAVTWIDSSGTLGDADGTSIKAQLFDAAGAKVGEEFLVNTATAYDQYAPAIVGLASGAFVVTWNDASHTLDDTDGTSIKAQMFDAAGAKIGGEFLVNSETASDQYAPVVSRLGTGGFIITWYDTSGTLGDADGTSIKAQLFDENGARVGGEFLVNTETGEDQTRPTVTNLANGAFAITWIDASATLGDPDGTSIKAQLFAADGTTIGSEFLVNTDVHGDQYNPAVAGLHNGGFAIAWYDGSGAMTEGDSLSIHAQVFAQNHADVSMAENQTDAATVTADYPLQSSTLSFSIADGADSASFQIDPDSGVLSFKTAPDFEHPIDGGADNVYDVGVVVTDGAQARTYTFAVTVTDANEAPVITSNGGGASASIAMAENQTAVTTVTAHDPDAGAVLQYTISGGADADLFQIDGTTGDLTFKAKLDFEHPADAGGDNVYDVIVQVSDGALAQSQALAVTVSNANEAPVMDENGGEANASITVSEQQTMVTTVTAHDPDAGTVLQYSIAGGADAELFQIDSATGDLTFKAQPDFEHPADAGGDNVYEVIVQASDGTDTERQTLSVSVSNVDEECSGSLSFKIESTVNGSGDQATVISASSTMADPDVSGPLALIHSWQVSSDGGKTWNVAQSGPDSQFSSVSMPSGTLIRDVVQYEDPFSIKQVVSGETALVGDANANTLRGSSGSDVIHGFDGADTLYGFVGNDTLYGGDGNDKLNGGLGDDTMAGGTGDDIYVVDSAGDVVTEAQDEGVDWVWASVSATLADNVERLVLTGSAAIDGTGNDADNMLIGNSADNVLVGLAGNDMLNGGAGNDTLYGGDGNDKLYGGLGDDTLYGGLGSNWLTGGAGQDFFVFDSIPNAQATNTIVDFNPADGDRIQFSHSMFESFTHAGALLPDEFYAAAGAKEAITSDQRVIYDTTSGKLYYDPDGVGGMHAMEFAVVGTSTHPMLAYSDFEIMA